MVTGNGDPTTPGGVNQVEVFAGSYVLAEGGPPGFTPGPWSCTGGVLDGTTVAVPPGGNVTCTITNTATPPTLTLVKAADNGTTGATTPATAWTLAAAGPSPISGVTGDPAVTAAPVQVGTYTLSESGPAGYTASAWVCVGGSGATADSVVLAEGQNATCTITNTAIQPTLTLVKLVDNGTTGGTAVPTDWVLSATGPVTIAGQTGSAEVTAAEVPVGTYGLGEAGPTGYTASPWSCVGGTAADGTVTLAVGQAATCTITNTAQQAALSVIKTVTNNNGGTALPTDWSMTATGPDLSITGLGGFVDFAVVPGTYQLSEAGPAGYTAGAWSCVGGTLAGSAVTIQLGQSASCTINNDDNPATLTLAKVVDPADSGSGAVPADWTVTAAPVTIPGQDPVSGNGDPTSSGGVDRVEVFAGSYTLSESGPDGFTPGDWVCEGGVLTGAYRHCAGRRQRHLHDHQHGAVADPHPGQTRRQRNHRRHRSADGLDAVRRRPDAGQRHGGGPNGDRGAGGSRRVFADRVRARRLHRERLELHRGRGGGGGGHARRG